MFGKCCPDCIERGEKSGAAKEKTKSPGGLRLRFTRGIFITICTKDRKCLFWENVGASIARPEDVQLSAYGSIVDTAIRNITKYYTGITLDHYVIMPNHIHLLLQIQAPGSEKAMRCPSVSIVIQQMKGYVTKQIGYSIWQKLFHDHVIRGEKDYLKIWEYIENNPMKWVEDCFFMAQS